MYFSQTIRKIFSAQFLFLPVIENIYHFRWEEAGCGVVGGGRTTAEPQQLIYNLHLW